MKLLLLAAVLITGLVIAPSANAVAPVKQCVKTQNRLTQAQYRATQAEQRQSHVTIRTGNYRDSTKLQRHIETLQQAQARACGVQQRV